MRRLTADDLRRDPEQTYLILRKIMRVCIRKKVHQYHVDELLQECWVTLAEVIAKNPEYENLTGLAITIARRGISDLYRSKKKNQLPQLPNDRAQAIPDDVAWVRELVSVMPEVHREVLVPFYFQHRTITEVGASLGICYRAVVYRLQKAREYFQELVESESNNPSREISKRTRQAQGAATAWKKRKEL